MKTPSVKKNPSGLNPIGNKVLVRPMAMPAKSQGGILLPDSSLDMQKAAMTRGEIVAMGGNAFEMFDRNEAWKGDKPAVGDTIVYSKYSGVTFPGADGADYRLMDDDDIPAIDKRPAVIPAVVSRTPMKASA